MRFQLFATLLLYSSLRLQAQVDYLKTYHPLIVQAEAALLDSNYTVALNHYQTAFQRVPRPFAKDFYNAAICAVELKKEDIAFQYLDSLITKGVKKSFFETLIPLQALKQHPKWQKWIQTFDGKFQQWNQDKNVTIRQTLKGLEYADQEFRSRPNKYERYRDTINQIDKMNVHFLKQIIQTNGFPNENWIGIENPMHNDLPAYVLFLHQFQKMSSGIGDFDFTEIVLKAVREGQLMPHTAAYWLTMSNQLSYNFGDTGLTIIVYKDQTTGFRVIRYNAGEKAKINENRQTFGLEPLESLYQKAIVKFNPKIIQKFAFADVQMSELNCGTQETFNKFLKTTEPIQ
ncbi:MAG: hypothetical protein RL329_2206 [Bacteroidota bacterium]|jgi:hypothetical protein